MKRAVFIFITVLLVLSLSSCDIISNVINLKSDFGNSSDSPKDDTINSENAENETDEHFCGTYFPDDYDPSGRIHLIGLEDYDKKHETYVLLSMDEVYEAVDLLRKNGSILEESVLFDCDDLPYTAIYFFTFKKSDAEELKSGKSYFDRRIDNGTFTCTIYYNNRTLEDVNTYGKEGDFSYIKIDEKYNVEDFTSNTDDLYVTSVSEMTGNDPYGFSNTNRMEWYYVNIGNVTHIELDALIGKQELDSAFMPEDIEAIVRTITIIEAV